MAGILSMKPENANRLHPEMLKWFNELSATIERQLAIDGLTVDDVESFLSDGEKDELVRYKNEIGMGLSASINPDAVYHTSLLYGNLGPAFLMVQLNLFARVQNIKSLLRKVYKRKAATKPEEVKKREEGERRTRVFEALRPPNRARQEVPQPPRRIREVSNEPQRSNRRFFRGRRILSLSGESECISTVPGGDRR